jgi:hypothetical protein
MGFLKVFGIALEWEDSKPYIDKIKYQGIHQIITWIKSVEMRNCNCPKFGYEVIIYHLKIA